MMRNGLNLMVYMLRLVETIFVATSYTRILHLQVFLVPTEESLNRYIPWLKEVQRAIVSFNYWMKMKIQLNWRMEKLMILY